MAGRAGLVAIAVDPHKHINAVEVVDGAGKVLEQRVFEHSTGGFKELTAFARGWRHRQWAVEGANGVGKNLAQRLVATGELVWDVPSKKSSLVRSFSATSGRKTDEVDAHAVALAALNTPGLAQVRTDDHTTALRLLTSRRRELIGLRVQAVNRVHRELQILIPGGVSVCASGGDRTPRLLLGRAFRLGGRAQGVRNLAARRANSSWNWKIPPCPALG